MTEKNKENHLVARIERAFGAAREKALRLALGDDGALWIARPRREMVLTCDWFLEGTHFLRDKHPADAVGWKCLARAVSDVAAMGGEPRCFLLSLALPKKLTGKWLDGFLRGLRRASKALRCELAGGDTTRRDEVLISVTVIGEVRRGGAILRSGAGPGDTIFVSGTLGEADLGLQQLRQMRGMGRPMNAALRKHLYPEPRLALGQWLAKRKLVTAMMDLSDGLSSDLPRLCRTSGVGARIEVDSLPVNKLRGSKDARTLALDGGDDYELLFTVKPRNVARVPDNFHGLRLTRIGEVTRERKIVVRTDTGKTETLRSGGWDPFQAA